MRFTKRLRHERILMVKLYYKYENFAEFATQWPEHFSTPSQDSRVIKTVVTDFEEIDTVEDAFRSGRP